MEEAKKSLEHRTNDWGGRKTHPVLEHTGWSAQGIEPGVQKRMEPKEGEVCPWLDHPRRSGRRPLGGTGGRTFPGVLPPGASRRQKKNAREEKSSTQDRNNPAPRRRWSNRRMKMALDHIFQEGAQ